nr:FCD domain-containing protein [Pseudonocardia sp. EC080625-04]
MTGVFEVRRAVEVEAARLAAVRTAPEGIVALRTMLSEQRSLLGGDAWVFVTTDVRFHRAVVASARTDLLGELFEQLAQPLGDVLTELLDAPSLPDTTGDQEALVAALEVRDADAAALATTPHSDL